MSGAILAALLLAESMKPAPPWRPVRCDSTEARWAFPAGVAPAPGALPGRRATVVFARPGSYLVTLSIVCHVDGAETVLGARRQTVIVTDRAEIFADDFESGDASAWHSSHGQSQREAGRAVPVAPVNIPSLRQIPAAGTASLKETAQ